MSSAVCSACLGRDGLLRVETLRGHVKLLESYETLANKKLIAAGGRAATLCFTCVSKLQRCRRLSDAAHKSHIIRQGMSARGVEVTHSDITALNLGTTQHLSVVALPHLTLTDNSNNESTPVTIKQEPTAVKEETMDDDLIDIGENTEDVAIYTSNNEGQCLIEETNSATNKDFYCGDCNKKFKTKISLISHLKLHSKKRCPTCSKTISCTNALIVHMRSHTGETAYVCKICDKTLTYASSLKKHMIIHTGEKPFACELCDKTFKRASNLKQHMIIHIGERAYVCNECHKTFRLASDLKKHIIIHVGERAYACKICDKNFSMARSVKQHMIIHIEERAFACKICDKTFYKAGNLKQHMLIHTGDRAFACKICEDTFSRASHLKRHMLTHTGEKPYVCNECDRTFSKSVSLKKHIMFIHTLEKNHDFNK